jgi:hypothetical protein
MKTKLATLFIAAVAALSSVQVASATPYNAEDDAWQMTPYHPGYSFRPIRSGNATVGQVILFEVQVSKGVDYVFLAGRDSDIQDLDIVVYDEVGTLLSDDRRTYSRAAVRFRPNYTGIANVYVIIKRAKYLGSYAVIAGVRGEEGRPSPFKQPTEPANPNGRSATGN